MPLMRNMRHCWQPSTLTPEPFGPQRSCRVCALAEWVDIGPQGGRVHVWQWLREERMFLDMPACPGDEPHQAEPYTLKLAIGKARIRVCGVETEALT